MSELIRVSAVPKLAPRDRDGHKGSYGRVLIVGGSRGMAGAVGLAGMAALRSGAGLVTVACPKEVIDVVSGYEPSYLTAPLPCDPQGRFSQEAIPRLPLEKMNVVGVGPGLGQSAALAALVAHVLDKATVPVVVDADALNVLVGRLAILKHREHPTVVTPHVGEFGRLVNKPIDDVLANKEEYAVRFAKEHNAVVILKGRHSIITDGSKIAINATGNPGMATGGSGDVLTGLVSALIGQGLNSFDAAHLGAHLHGLAGDLAADHLGEVSLIASDLVAFLAQAFKKLRSV